MKHFLPLLLCAVLACPALVPASDYSITAASVIASSSAKTKLVVAGASVTAGQLVYKDSATSTYKLARANAIGTASPAGIALNTASSGQPLKIVISDPDFTPGVSATEGVHLMLSSANAGGIAPAADLTTGAFPFVFGIVKNGGHWRIDFESALYTAHALP
jgi:hypothetical protein